MGTTSKSVSASASIFVIPNLPRTTTNKILLFSSTLAPSTWLQALFTGSSQPALVPSTASNSLPSAALPATPLLDMSPMVTLLLLILGVRCWLRLVKERRLLLLILILRSWRVSVEDFLSMLEREMIFTSWIGSNKKKKKLLALVTKRMLIKNTYEIESLFC